jgi:hypothetical protein
MPIVSAFSGIVVRMYYHEHGPPHFHAEHGDDRATFAFDGKLLAGRIRSQAAIRKIRRWAGLHTQELEANWARLIASRPLERIEPLR